KTGAATTAATRCESGMLSANAVKMLFTARIGTATATARRTQRIVSDASDPAAAPPAWDAVRGCIGRLPLRASGAAREFGALADGEAASSASASTAVRPLGTSLTGWTCGPPAVDDTRQLYAWCAARAMVVGWGRRLIGP